MTILSIILLFIVLCYVLLIAWLTVGFFKTTTFNIPSNKVAELSYTTKVSVVVALKNEENNIATLMQCLVSQTYPFIEIILVDNNSDDSTFIKLSSYEQINLYSSKGGKKAAIAYGVGKASGDLIITTDADCKAGVGWITSIVSFYNQNNHPKMILAPVRFEGRGVFADIQALEFSTLIASTCGSASMNRAIMCNAANMAFEKSIYHEVDLRNEYTSGDDMFLLQSVKHKYGANSIKFIKSEAAIVNTYPNATFKEFINQRVRWTSKSGGYNDSAIIISAAVIFSFCFLTLSLLLGGVFNIHLLYLGLFLILLKMVVDFPIVISISVFFKQKRLLSYYPLEQLLYVIYIPTIAIASLFNNKYKH